MYNYLLIDEPPLQVLPSLAAKIGLNEAIFLQQLNYWIRNKKTQGRIHEGKKWIRNTAEEWCDDNFPFWDTSVVKRVIKNLESDGLISSTSKLNKIPIDRTKWYTINSERVEEINQSEGPIKRIADKSAKRKKARASRGDVATRTVQNVPVAKVQNVPIAEEQIEPMAKVQNVPDSLVQNVPSNTRNYTETTTSNSNELEGGKPQPSADSDFPDDTEQWILDTLQQSIAKIKKLRFTAEKWQSLLDTERQRKKPRVTLEAFVLDKLESNPNLPPDQNKFFDTPECQVLLEKVSKERQADNRNDLTKFPSLACKQKYLEAAGKLNGTLETAIEKALVLGITDIGAIVNYVASPKWLEAQPGGDSGPKRPHEVRAIPREQLVKLAQRRAAGGI